MVQGLGFPSLSNLKTVPVFFNMIDNGFLDAPTFGLYLNPNPTAEPAGEIIFGGVNQTYFAGDLFEVPVVVKSCAGLPAVRMRTLWRVLPYASPRQPIRCPSHCAQTS